MKHNVASASKLRTLLECYLKSCDVTQFENLCDLLICDRSKSSLFEGCLKYVLSVESGKMGQNWLPINELTAAIDNFLAARADATKPRAFAVGQMPHSPRHLNSVDRRRVPREVHVTYSTGYTRSPST